MTNVEMAAIFRRIGDLLEIRGDNPFKIAAYRRAAETLETLDRPASELIAAGVKVAGFGEAISSKIEEMERTGRLRFYEELTRTVPLSLLELLRVPDVGPRKARLFYEQLGVTNLEELEAAATGGRLAGVKGIGPRTAARLLMSIQEVRSRGEKVPLGVALRVARLAVAGLAAVPGVERVAVAGSVRRVVDLVGDVDLVAVAEAPLRAVDAFCGLPFVAEVTDRGALEASVRTPDGVCVDLLVVAPDHVGAALLYLTGSREHNAWLRARAAGRGLRLDPRGVYPAGADGDAAPVAAATEAAMYAALDLPWLPPEVREAGPLTVIEREGLPPLLDLTAIQGDLHSHTEWSDGALPLAAMAEAGRARGYRYLAITDHSRGLGFVGGLTVERLQDQAAQVRALNARWPDGSYQVLAGTEMEVRADGTLDFPDEVLAGLDWVIASVHSAFKQDRDAMTARLIRAVQSPHVHLLGHPTGRLVGRRSGYDFDHAAVFRAAAAAGTAVEINAHPERLDLCDTDVALAAGLGCTIAINTDAHSPADFDVLQYGASVARRALLSPDRVLNTRDAAGVRAFVARKRALAAD